LHVASRLTRPTDTWPLQRGFDEFFGTIIGAGSFYDPNTLTRGNDNVEHEAQSDDSFFYTDAISDQAVRFIEQHHLKPGEAIAVEARDAAADSVRVRGKNDQRITIGTRAASKLLVQVAQVLLLCILALPAFAQTPQTTAARREAPLTNLSGYMDSHFNNEEFTDAPFSTRLDVLGMSQ
jgi:hypothetical protein